MNTKRLTSSQQHIIYAAELLLEGHIVAFPTETVYGLGAVVFNAHAVQSIFAAKGRPSDNPLIVHCVSREDVERVAVNIPHLFDRLFQQFCPGPLTMLLEKHPAVPDVVTGGLPTVAVRFPAHPVAEALIRTVGVPLVAPSANRSGYPSPTCANHVVDDLQGRISAVIDGGECPIGIESTVLNILSEPPVILRPGSVTKHDVEKICGEVAYVHDYVAQTGSQPLAPGMKYRHYAPQARIVLVNTLQEAHQAARNLGERVGDSAWILASSVKKAGYGLFPLCEQTLYATFRKADTEGVGTLIIVCDAQTRRSAGLMNRIEKAARSQ
jgi:L-threonylcarbamoyladenylate synthase